METPEWIPLGKFGRAHGRHGEVRLWAYNMGTETLRKGLKAFIRYEDDTIEEITIERLRWTDRFALIGIKGINTRDEAEAFCHAELMVTRDALPPTDDDEVYLVDLIGLPVFAQPEGEPQPRVIGAVWDFMETGANDVMIIRIANEKNFLVPMLDHVIRLLDPVEGRVELAPLAEWAPPEVVLPVLDEDDMDELFGDDEDDWDDEDGGEEA